MQIKRIVMVMLVVALVGPVFGVPAGVAPVAAQGETLPRFEPGECPFDAAGYPSVECGKLIVPEDRSNPASPSIRLQVVILRALNEPKSPDPVVYLQGGPGAPGVSRIDTWAGSYLRLNRDLILLDQRGVGLSEPSLNCPEVEALAVELADNDIRLPDIQAQVMVGALTCRDRLTAQGVNLAAYNTVANAADVEDLRRALGIESWNLFGISYGTRLALTVLRDYPDNVRSVVLDGVTPLQRDGYSTLTERAADAMARIFAACQIDPVCTRSFPTFQQQFEELVTRLNAAPVTVVGQHPYDGSQLDVLLTGDNLLLTAFNALYNPGTARFLPLVIARAYAEDYTRLADLTLFSALNWAGLSEGMLFSVMCREDLAFADQATIDANAAAYPLYAGIMSTQAGDLAICGQWGSGQADPSEKQPVTSNVPVLLLSGGLDPVTPPVFADEVAATLPNHYAYTFPALAHGVTQLDWCPLSVALTFLDTPTAAPEVACLANQSRMEFQGN